MHGDILSLVLFTTAMEEIFKQMEIETNININDEWLNNLRFVNNSILFPEREIQLSTLLKNLNK